MGRRGPKPGATPLRKRRISVFLTPEEIDKLTDRAGGKDKVPRYLRDAGLDRLPRPVPEFNRQVYVELARANGNLNQLSRRVNTAELAAAGGPSIEEIKQALDNFRARLIGADEDEVAES